MSLLTEVFLLVSNALLVPVLLLLLWLFARSLVLAGGFCRESLERRSSAAPAIAGTGGRAGLPPHPSPALRRFVAWYGSRRPNDPPIGRWIGDRQAEMRGSIETTALMSKVGPMLGLAGTLIPLGPALQGLAAGDVSALANNLIVAFTTTVLGLAVAGTCFAISTMRRRWYDEDLRAMEEWHRVEFARVPAASKGEQAP